MKALTVVYMLRGGDRGRSGNVISYAVHVAIINPRVVRLLYLLHPRIRGDDL